MPTPILGPTIETERLVLRPPCAADFDAWAAFMADEEAARYVGGAVPRPLAWRAMAAMTGAWALQGFGMFSVLERSGGRWIGRVGPWMPDGWPGTEVGWGLAREAWGKGYAKEAASASPRGKGRLPAPLHGSEIEIWGQTREEWRSRRR